ncbi:MAG: hypothetical protein LBH94_01020 [Deltaproteobacteria bacterium]|jgi:hypothetical protein|nr:hypothetical protein [Deltaproteobacteria bacterium]
MPEEDVFANACLLHWRSRCWSGTKVLAPVLVEELCGNPLPEWLIFKGKKHLVAPEYLAPPRDIARAVRREIRNKCLPFPIRSLCLVPKAYFAFLEDKLRAGKEEFQQAVQVITDTYEDSILEAERHLGRYFFRSDYPPNIAEKYSMDWSFYIFPNYGSNSAITAEEYEAQRKQFSDMMDDVRELANAALRKEFADIVAHLAKRLAPKADGTRMVVRHEMFDAFQAFFAEFHNRNIFQDEELARLVERAQGMLSAVEDGNLGEDVWLREQIVESLTGIKEQIDEALIAEPRRRIRHHPL